MTSSDWQVRRSQNMQAAMIRNNQPVDEDILTHLVPSVFASRASETTSANYSFLPTINIVRALRECGWLVAKANEQRVVVDHNRGFQKHMIRFRQAGHFGRLESVHVGDSVPEIVLVNSHDAKSAYRLHAGIFRLVCTNGMVICDETIESMSVRHTGQEIERVVNASKQLANSLPAVIGQIDAFRARRLSPIESRALAEGAIITRWGDLSDAPVGADKVLTARRGDDRGDDLWHTLNRVQENVIEGGQRDWRQAESGKRPVKSRAVSSIAENLRINKALWHMATLLQAGQITTAAAQSN